MELLPVTRRDGGDKITPDEQEVAGAYRLLLGEGRVLEGAQTRQVLGPDAGCT